MKPRKSRQLSWVSLYSRLSDKALLTRWVVNRNNGEITRNGEHQYREERIQVAYFYDGRELKVRITGVCAGMIRQDFSSVACRRVNAFYIEARGDDQRYL